MNWLGETFFGRVQQLCLQPANIARLAPPAQLLSNRSRASAWWVWAVEDEHFSKTCFLSQPYKFQQSVTSVKIASSRHSKLLNKLEPKSLRYTRPTKNRFVT